ncbi:hypothetical protein CTheo_5557 [Ceratobasidium theobromae]|uniref:C3H1-type domain-containing protein n=1 Tax=Ceratobasidium theobromae TaxID=1582974 RepID=A0A5N5QH47_9AGAM|nr:hypothetical protein CTheo_5557 [Ceratobasidium theobromae]
MDSLPKRPNTPPSPPRRGSRHVSPPTAQRPGPSSWEPPRPRSPGIWDRERGRPMFRPRSRSRSRSFDYNYDYQRRRSPPLPHPHSRLPRRAWERSRSRSPPPPSKSPVLCKYFSRPTGCDKGNRCRFRHERPRSRSFSPSRSRSRSPRSRSPPMRYRRGESPMLIPRGGLRSPQPSLLQRLGPVAPMRPVSPMRSRAVSNDPTEPLEEGEERSPGRRTGRSRGRGRRRPDRNKDKANWDSFVADEDELMSEDDGRGSKRGYESHRGRSRSRSPRGRSRTPSNSRSRSPHDATAASTRSNSKEKRSRHSVAYPPPSRSHSRSHSTRLRSPTRSRDHTPPRGRSRARSRSRSPSRQSRSGSQPSHRQSPPDPNQESLPEREKNSTSAPNPSSSLATASSTSPSIPTGPRWRAGANPQTTPASVAPAARAVPVSGRGGPPPTGPRGDREPPRGPRNMVASSMHMAAGVGGTGMGSGPGWERPQLAFQNYLAAVQSKLEEREGKKKEEEPSPEGEPKIVAEAKTAVESDAMDLDDSEERKLVPPHLNTPIPGPSAGGSSVASPAQSNVRRASASLHASPAIGQGVPLPTLTGASQSHTTTPSAIPATLPPTHPFPLPPRPRSPPRMRSPPRGPRATRLLPDKAKGAATETGPERDRGTDPVGRGGDKNHWTDKDRTTGEAERKAHPPATNPARHPRMPPIRATKRESLFPDLERELASLEEQRTKLANEHFPLEIALRQAVDELALSTIDCRAAEDRRVMTETVLEAMMKGGGLAASGDI